MKLSAVVLCLTVTTEAFSARPFGTTRLASTTLLQAEIRGPTEKAEGKKSARRCRGIFVHAS